MTHHPPSRVVWLVFGCTLVLCRPAWAHGIGVIIFPLMIGTVILIAVPVLALIEFSFIKALPRPELRRISLAACLYIENLLILLAVRAGIGLLGEVMVIAGIWNFDLHPAGAWALFLLQMAAMFLAILAISFFFWRVWIGLALTAKNLAAATTLSLIVFGLFAMLCLPIFDFSWFSIPVVPAEELRTTVDAEVFFIRGDQALGLNLRTGEERSVAKFDKYGVLHVEETVPEGEGQRLEYWSSGNKITLSTDPGARYFLGARIPGPGCSSEYVPGLRLPLGRIRQPTHYDAEKSDELGISRVWLHRGGSFVDYRRMEDMKFFIGDDDPWAVETQWREEKRSPARFAMSTPFIRYTPTVLAVFSDGKALLGVWMYDITWDMALFLYDPERNVLALVPVGRVEKRVFPLEYEAVEEASR